MSKMQKLSAFFAIVSAICVRAADEAEAFLYSSGLLTDLTKLVTKTTALRTLVLSVFSILTAHGVLQGNLTESGVALAVTILTALTTQFVAYVQTKYGQQVQAAGGALPDGFVGPETAAAVQRLALAAAPTILAALNKAAADQRQS